MKVCYVLYNSKEHGGSQVLVSTAAILRGLCGDAPLIPEEEKVTFFFATAPEVDPSAHSSPTLPNVVVDELPPHFLKFGLSSSHIGFSLTAA